MFIQLELYLFSWYEIVRCFVVPFVIGLTYSKLSDAVPVVLNTGMVELKQKGDVCLSNLDIDLLTKLISFLQCKF
jgi:hypothetical protein